MEFGIYIMSSCWMEFWCVFQKSNKKQDEAAYCE